LISPGADAEEEAAMAALGLLSPREEAGLKRALVAEMASAAALLAETAAPRPPNPALRARVTARIAAYEAVKPLADVRPHDGGWVYAGAPGVDMRRLFRDKETGRTTILLRMEPGARIPAHRHGDDEQCLVVSGDIRWGELVYREGDFVVMGKGSNHPEIYSEGGNVLLLVAGRNEFI
jgi:anti-sigma factor ChrR (cupin superfamily)